MKVCQKENALLVGRKRMFIEGRYVQMITFYANLALGQGQHAH